MRAAIGAYGEVLADQLSGWDAVPFRRTASCGHALGDVGVAWSTAADACYPTNVATCGSVWACPVCSAKIRASRTADVEHLAGWHTSGGGRLLMVTLTLSHGADDSLAHLVDGLIEAWRSVQRDREWRRLRRGLVGFTKSLEVTHGFSDAGQGNGWHPHLHLLLLVPASRSSSDLFGVDLEVEMLLESAWGDAVANLLGEDHRPSLERGIDVRWIGADAAAYVTKIAQEVTLGDLKSGARSVWSLVARSNWARFGEFCNAMKGRASVQWSRGLRAACGLGVEISDEERCALDLEDGLLVAMIDGRHWNTLVRTGRATAYLEGLERRCRAVRAPDRGGGLAA